MTTIFPNAILSDVTPFYYYFCYYQRTHALLTRLNALFARLAASLGKESIELESHAQLISRSSLCARRRPIMAARKRRRRSVKVSRGAGK